ncbi:DUF1353 domain-containing protein [Thalassotalea sp. Y01]|uniref:DUF1353 domain-containing protein n=1 Tax=Thalassotalea sp. Y01 TaxID=2729613 RepID=UPI00145EA539|nr:DUF1353 domain-containing protein [Thalassotalea sp. Y01]NMP16319.1 DUF1353 domain-containing protein [Thalassotalea sp. Y01]
MTCISFKKGYKYQLVESYCLDIPITPDKDVESPSGYIKLSATGALVIKKGYAWDGPSGPTIDSKNFMRGSLVHDALYQLMREQLLDNTNTREAADRLLQDMCKQDGMSSLRAWLVYLGLRLGGNLAASPDNRKSISIAPKDCQQI